MAFFPIFMNLDDQKVLIAGGGHTGYRKAAQLLPYGARVVVVSPQMTEQLQALEAQQERLMLVHRPVREADIEGAAMVIAATDQPQLNHRLGECCRAAGIPVNVVDDPDWCTFYYPSLVRQGDLVIGISTAGKSPLLSRHLRERLEGELEPWLGTVTERMGEARSWARETLPTQRERSLALHRIFAALMERQGEMTMEEMRAAARGRKEERPCTE